MVKFSLQAVFELQQNDSLSTHECVGAHQS
ncbi:hypothetical protein IHE45_18G049200 [Dioscorea alata]|uniref:Uncharacterized protein n=1 Tax=Dioscorea alata TaxID=55571 RepID=A0ACB7U6P7_DIOAL|nr:hypothetical protein IHE45_18G049200 [Dioscorea alata]